MGKTRETNEPKCRNVKHFCETNCFNSVGWDGVQSVECEDNEDGGVLSGECARKKGLLAKTCPRRSADPMSSVEKLKARGPVETVCTAFCPGGTGLWRWFSRGFRRQRPAVTFWSSKPAEPVSSVVFCPGGVRLCKTPPPPTTTTKPCLTFKTQTSCFFG